MSAPIQARPVPGGPGGRPRDATRDGVVLQAVRELLAEEGYQALSVHKVTLRCGVHVRTIARRWEGKAEMAAAAVLGGDARLYADLVPGLPTGRLAADVREMIDQTMQYLADPATRAALPALMAELEVNDTVRELFMRREEEWITVIRAVLESAVASGDAPERVLWPASWPGRPTASSSARSPRAARACSTISPASSSRPFSGPDQSPSQSRWWVPGPACAAGHPGRRTSPRVPSGTVRSSWPWRPLSDQATSIRPCGQS